VTAQDICQRIGSDSAVIRAMVRAEQTGIAIVRGITLLCTGYVYGVDEFSAATATYAVRY
jgi:hypothetical protein